MPRTKATDAEFIEIWRKLGSPVAVARETGITARAVLSRRRDIEQRYDIVLDAWNDSSPVGIKSRGYGRLTLDVDDGAVVVFSDAHYHPGDVTTAHRALLRFLKEHKGVKAVVANGDLFDGASAGRWGRIGWEQRPTVAQELQACQARLLEIERAAKGKRRIWLVGNHDMRFETNLAANAAAFEGVPGFRLTDHFPSWTFGLSLWINDVCVVKHRWKGGLHATHNNAVLSGKSMVTGHLHSAKVTPYTDYAGTRWGVDTGTLADPDSEKFEAYTEDGPKNWRSGFAVLTFHEGELLQPELVLVRGEGKAEFRGKVWDV